MFHLIVRHLLLQQQINSLTDLVFDAEMGWTFCIIWFLYVSVSECGPLPDSEPLMYGEVQSPQYPQPYPPNLQQQWDLSVPEGYQIRLTFTHLDIEASAGCHYDALTVLYDDKVLEKFCGNEHSADGHHPGTEPILSPGNRLTLLFQTDDSNPERRQNVGFSAQYQAIDIDECSLPEPADGSGPLCSQICLNTLGSYLCSCHHGYELRSDQRTCLLSCSGGIFDEPEGHLFSPGYPNPPPHAVSCQYIIAVESGFTVSLNFTDNFHIESVDTEQGPNCHYHWLQVTIPDKEPMKLCGGKSPGLIETNSNTVTLEYHTDSDGQSSGWSLDYSTQRVKCPFPGNVAKGRVTPSLTEYLYRDYIFVRCDQGYKLMMEGQEIKSFSTMCQSNGQWHLPLPECQIFDCGEPKPLLNGGVNFLSGFQNQYGSVVQYYCNEPFYSLLGGITVVFTCDADRKWRSNNEIVISPTCIPVCGQPTNLIPAYQRIIGGSEAPENTIPWQVLLSIDGQRAGGMVIADRWIMTAAHVLVHRGNIAPKESVRVYMGLTNVRTLLSSPVFADSVHVHPEYRNPTDEDYNNDIALIKLQNPITFNSSVMPICLPAEGSTYVTGMMGLVSGFGLTEEKKRRILTNKLKYVQLPVVEQDTCSNSITLARRTREHVPSLTNNMFCAGVPEGGKDSCQGDSGGPFAMSDDDGRFWAAGVVSWGVDCGRQGTYGVYTRVTSYVDWINKTMQEN
ncbi:complement C1r-A subcomponent-like isoform X1 [Pagrus major]|uniref:complement C1r-A subcomponent-like isoform X1 n=1 Tax=Pagrus major TaxID=143350 RepID=UPI003CC83C60